MTLLLLKPDVEELARGLSKYANYLNEQTKTMRIVHMPEKPIRQIAENLHICSLPKCHAVSSELLPLLSVLQDKELFEYIILENIIPTNPSEKYEYLQTLKKSGLPMEVLLMTYSHGNNVGNLHFLWKVSGSSSTEYMSRSQSTIEKAKEEIPVYHTRAMRRALFEKFGRIAPTMKPAILRGLYRELTNDVCAPSCLSEAEIDERVQMVLDMEDPNVVIDLRHLNSGRKGQYDIFWEQCKVYLEECVGTAVDDRRHTTVTHLANAVSARDLKEKVQLRCPDGTKIPSESWIRLQFWPKTPHARSKIHYTGKLNVRYMVQARQFRKEHPDAHYAAAIFRYQREYSIRLRDYCNFVSIDDKHRVKVGYQWQQQREGEEY